MLWKTGEEDSRGKEGSWQRGRLEGSETETETEQQQRRNTVNATKKETVMAYRAVLLEAVDTC